MSDAPIDDWEQFVTEKALRDAGKVVWLEARVRQLEAEQKRLQAAMKYLRACAHLFPHTNTDRSHESVGLPDDAPDAWCLGCTVAATTAELYKDLDRELLNGDDEAADNERARQWVAEYESREVEDT